jgi:hypothetical protein
VRNAFQERAWRHDATAAARLLAIDYQPREHRLPVVPLLSAAGLTGAAAVLAAALTLGSSAAPAFAGWTPTPTVPAPRQIASALRRCSSELRVLASGAPELVETRGPYTAAVYARPGGAGACVQGASVSFSGTASNLGTTQVGAAQIQTFFVIGTDSSGRSFTVLDGRLGADVKAVRIARNNGTTVTATLSHGWYLAWWPDSAHATHALITTSSGIQTASLPPAVTQRAPSCGRTSRCGAVGIGNGGLVAGQGGRETTHIRRATK